MDFTDPYGSIAGKHFHMLFRRYGAPIIVLSLVKVSDVGAPIIVLSLVKVSDVGVPIIVLVKVISLSFHQCHHRYSLISSANFPSWLSNTYCGLLLWSSVLHTTKEAIDI